MSCVYCQKKLSEHDDDYFCSMLCSQITHEMYICTARLFRIQLSMKGSARYAEKLLKSHMNQEPVNNFGVTIPMDEIPF